MTLFEINIWGITIAPSFYGLMYVIGIFSGYYIIKTRKFIDDEKLDNLLFYIFLGIVLGGRLGYIVFYNPGYYLEHLGEVLQVWKGGMSFHGGVIGVIIACALFSKLYKVNFYKIMDEVAYVGTIGLFFGRIGNYFNKELLGFPYNGPLAVIKDGVGYFPSPLMEAILEGLLLFVILSYFQANKKFNGQIGALFLILYAIFRIIVESGFRLPDPQIGMFTANMSLGSVLSYVMLGAGMFFYGYLWFSKNTGKVEEQKTHISKKHRTSKKK